jgi:hypothetical protein
MWPRRRQPARERGDAATAALLLPPACWSGKRRQRACLPDAASSLCSACAVVLQETLGACGRGREVPRECCPAFGLHGCSGTHFPSMLPLPWPLLRLRSPAYLPCRSSAQRA